MTATLRESPSQSDSLDSDTWEGLPDAEIAELPPPQELKPDTTPDAPPGTCQTCGEPIIREPGARGRLPKYHPDCRPLKSAGTNSVASPRGRRNGKAEAEAEAVVAAIQKQIVRGCVMLSVVDRFDAFAVMASLPEISNNLKGVLARNDKWRREFMALESGGSVIALVLSIVMMLLPIAAHHGLLGRGMAAKFLVEMPFTLVKIQQRLKEGTEALTKMMQEQLERAAEENRKAAQKPVTPTVG